MHRDRVLLRAFFAVERDAFRLVATATAPRTENSTGHKSIKTKTKAVNIPEALTEDRTRDLSITSATLYH